MERGRDGKRRKLLLNLSKPQFVLSHLVFIAIRNKNAGNSEYVVIRMGITTKKREESGIRIKRERERGNRK